MSEEKRKSFRSQCVLPAELVKIEGKDNLVKKTTAQDISDEGLKLTISSNLNPGSILELRLYLPEKKLSASLIGEVTWSKAVGKKFEVGLKIKEMDKKLKDEILDWVFPGWLEKQQGSKENRK